MAVDPNEITGFVLSCVNEGWLLSLEKLCRERLEALAATKAKPVQGPTAPIIQRRPELAEHLRKPPAHPMSDEGGQSED